MLFCYIAPADLDQVIIIASTPSSILVTWDQPATPNGVIVNYTVLVDGSPTDTIEISDTCKEIYANASCHPESYLCYAELSPLIFLSNITMLEPFISYNISLEACNSAGCIMNSAVVGMTTQAGKL